MTGWSNARMADSPAHPGGDSSSDDHDAFHDDLVRPGTAGLPDRFFDRFVFNLHAPDSTGLSVLCGAGLYPSADTADGFAILVRPGEQRNLRFSTELSGTDGARVGPFSWSVVEPMAVWRLRLGPNPTGLELDCEWQARTDAWSGELVVRDGDRVVSTFDHLFQSGRFTGWLQVDGERQDVGGWFGQRDRSRGVRTLAGGQGLHLWVQAQFPDRSIGFIHVEDRAHRRLMLEGAVMHEGGRLDRVVDVRHALTFDDGLDLRTGRCEVTTSSGDRYLLDVDATARGAYMAGGGYGGHHGRRLGADHVEHDAYPLDGSVSPRTLDSALTDRLATFDGRVVPAGTAQEQALTGIGVFEFAHSRSGSYAYVPSLQ
jgi:hypothetical protein